jgi:hypothetical protein
MQEPHSITKKDLIYAFTGHPADPSRKLSTPELLERLDIGLKSLKEARDKKDRRLEVAAANGLRGALIRLAQAYGDPEVAARVDEYIDLTIDVINIG